MKRYLILFALSCLYATLPVYAAKQLRVLQLNIWHEGTVVEGGFEAIADEIVHTDADVVFFSEVRNYNDCPFVNRILRALADRGHGYYGRHNGLDVGIISRYEIIDQEEVYPNATKGGSGSLLRALLRAEGRCIAAYSAHLDYKNYACYLPRGYNGATWKKMEAPITDPQQVLEANRIAYREEVIQLFIDRARRDLNQGHTVLLGGDFNEPSHLDWGEDTRHLWDHNGSVVRWDCSSLLLAGGFKDSYRVIHPNPVSHPGFTFPSDNALIPVGKLSWAPEADERDRIDFIYYHPDGALQPVSASVVGPSTSIVRSQRKEEGTEDPFVLPKGVWPSDHKGVLTVFEVN